MTIKSILSRLKDTILLGSDDIFSIIFKPIQERYPQLHKDAAAFCAGGEPGAVLLQARQAVVPDAREAFGPLAMPQAYWYHKQTAAMLARPKAYTMMAEGRLAPEVIVRMGKVFAELLAAEIRKHTHDDFPDWLHVVLSDWLYWHMDNPMWRQRKVAGAPALSLKILGDLCRADDLPEYTWLSYYLDRKGVSSSYWGFDRCLVMLRSMEGLDLFLTEHRDAVLAGIAAKLAAGGKAQLLTEIGELNLTGAYAEFIMGQSVAGGKRAGAKAAQLMAGLPREDVLARLKVFLSDGKAGERKQAAELIGRFMGESGTDVLEAALEKESSKSIKSAIQVALGATRIQEESTTEDDLDIPPYAPPDLDARVAAEMAGRIHANILKLKEKYKDMPTQYAWQKKNRDAIRSLSQADADKVVKIMNGQSPLKNGWHTIANFMNEGGLYDDPSIELVNILRLHGAPRNQGRSLYYHFAAGPLGLWMKRRPEKFRDLRALSDVLDHLGWPEDTLEKEILHAGWRQSFLALHLPPEGLWPYFASRMEPLLAALIGQGAGEERYQGVCMDRVLEILACFPRLPGGARAPLLQIALGEGKTYRSRAQALLEGVAGIENKVTMALQSNTQNVRANAAQWLGRLGAESALAPLKAAMAKESREAVRATMINALEQLGEDISTLLRADLLHKEAVKGLKKAIPKGLSWFPFDSLPPLAWSDGGAVDPVLPRWWIVLACKLKDTGGGELMLKYLQRLDRTSRQALGLFVLRAFIARDTRTATLEEAEDRARQGAAALFQQWQQWIKRGWGDTFKGKTIEDAHAAIRREVLGTYLGSAIKEKGILALCACCPGSEVVPMMRGYMKDHYTRRHQIEAMLRAVASGDDPHVIQLLLSVARRYRTRSVQNTAAELVQAVADRNGWTPDQLADRTMPTAGFENDGTQVLDYGARQFTLRLDDQLKPVLTNESHKPIKALPAARQADNAELVKEAKARFSAAKKELKQVVQLTVGRFYEAMCAARQWPVDEWRRYIFDHPIAMRLIQRLVWRLEDDGRRFCFRPSEDGTLLDTEDQERSLGDSGTVCLVHRSLLSEGEADAWRRHLKDYAVKPLFEQLERPMVTPQIDPAVKGLNTYEGYVSDTFTLRGTLTKLGYQRGAPEDGGFFYYYYKDFASLGLRAVIFFTGNCVPEENLPAALEQMAFCTIQDNGWFNEQAMLPLKSVPPILLSEIMADYQYAAEKTGGFDPDWKKKMPW